MDPRRRRLADHGCHGAASVAVDLHPKVCLVTGSARRVGAAIVRALHAAGADVAIHYRNSRQDAERLAAELELQRAGSSLLLQGDLLNIETLPKLVEAVVQYFGRLDVLVNNASSFYASPLGQISSAMWEDLIGTNLKVPLFLAQAAASELRKTKGAIINIVDIYAERPHKDFVVYSSAKAGLVGLTKSLARELGPEIRVNGVAPGVALWPEASCDQAEQQSILAQIPLQRPGSPEDIAGAVKFLAFEAPYISGQILTVDGGRSIFI